MTKLTIEEGEEIQVAINGRNYRISAGFDTMTITTLNGTLTIQPSATNQVRLKSTSDSFDLEPKKTLKRKASW